jgi:hypothetical protein
MWPRTFRRCTCTKTRGMSHRVTGYLGHLASGAFSFAADAASIAAASQVAFNVQVTVGMCRVGVGGVVCATQPMAVLCGHRACAIGAAHRVRNESLLDNLS